MGRNGDKRVILAVRCYRPIVLTLEGEYDLLRPVECQKSLVESSELACCHA